jgi:hypothetical protein
MPVTFLSFCVALSLALTVQPDSLGYRHCHDFASQNTQTIWPRRLTMRLRLARGSRHSWQIMFDLELRRRVALLFLRGTDGLQKAGSKLVNLS